MKKSESKNKNLSSLILAGMASLTLGLAPFYPEPHLIGKLKWVFGGGAGMKLQDYLDLLMHGLPWIVFFYFGINYLVTKNT